MRFDYTPQERIAKITDIMAEGVLALIAAINYTSTIPFLSLNDINDDRIVFSDIIFSRGIASGSTNYKHCD
jgi:hypothetical protein